MMKMKKLKKKINNIYNIRFGYEIIFILKFYIILESILNKYFDILYK